MRTFLGIGASHLDDVFDFTYRMLSRFKPQAITLEARMRFTNVGESCKGERDRVKKFHEGRYNVRYETGVGDVRRSFLQGFEPSDVSHDNVRQVKLFLDDLCVLNGNSLEFNPALAYALESGIPFYFVDVPLLDKSIVKFTSNGYEVISLDGQAQLTQDIPADSLPFRRDDVTRNRFAADAINFLFSLGNGCVAHIGGTGHFNVQYLITDRWAPYPRGYQNHVQDFVKAERVFIADTNTGKLHRLLPKKAKRH